MLESRAAKVAILKTKLVEIEEKIANEKAIGVNVRKVMPVKIEQNNANDSAASAATAMAIAELQKYYAIDFDSNSYEGKTVLMVAHRFQNFHSFITTFSSQCCRTRQIVGTFA